MTVVLLADGTVTVLGNSTYTSTLNVPAGLTGVKAVAAGYHHAMALKSDGTGWPGAVMPAKIMVRQRCRQVSVTWWRLRLASLTVWP